MAASALPPPSPPPIGVRFSSLSRPRAGTPARPANRCAARTIRLSPPAGTAGSSQENSSSPASSALSRSARSIDTIRERIS